MLTYVSLDGIPIKIGQSAKENDILTSTSSPNEWWMHATGCTGAHVVICYDGDVIPKETRKDAAILAIHHSSAPNEMKMACVDMVRVGQVKHTKTPGQVMLSGDIHEYTLFRHRENHRLERLKYGYMGAQTGLS